jgi:hypothetical protein
MALNDAWMETCLIGISKIGGEEVQFASQTETADFDIGEKDIEGVALVSGGRVTKWTMEGDSSITFEAYPLEAGAGQGFYDLMHDDNVLVTSTTTSTSSNKLEDTSVNFTTLGIAIGDKIINLTDNTTAFVTAVDDLDTLSISSDIMASGEDYTITNSPYRVLNSRVRNKYRIMVLWTDKTGAVRASEAVANTLSALRIGYAGGYVTSVKPSFTDGILKYTITYKCAAFDKSGASNIMMESCAAGGGSDALPTIAAYTTSSKFD